MTDDERDAARWAAVEEAAEVLVDGDHPGALQRLKGAVEADPENPYAYHYIGVALFELKRYEPARDAYRAAVKFAPNYLSALVGLSHSERLYGDASSALVAAEDALERFPKDGDALYAAGLALAALGRRKKATGYLQRFLATKPELEAQLEARSVLEMLALGNEGDPFRTG